MKKLPYKTVCTIWPS